MIDSDDAPLIDLCIRKDSLAWNKFVDRFARLIFWAIRDTLKNFNHTCNQQDIEDIFQNVFVLLWEKNKLRQIQNKKDIIAWLSMVSANCTRDYLRNKKKMLPDRPNYPEETSYFDADIQANTIRLSLFNILDKAFSCLSAKELVILKLNYFYDKTHHQISQLLAIPIDSVSSIIKRSKERLKQQLARDGFKEF